MKYVTDYFKNVRQTEYGVDYFIRFLLGFFVFATLIITALLLLVLVSVLWKHVGYWAVLGPVLVVLSVPFLELFGRFILKKTIGE